MGSNICKHCNDSVDFQQLKRRNTQTPQNTDDEKIWFELTPSGFRQIPKPAHLQ